MSVYYYRKLQTIEMGGFALMERSCQIYAILDIILLASIEKEIVELLTKIDR